MRRPHVAVINESELSDVDVQEITVALQRQVDHDYGPLWGIAAVLTFVAKGEKPPPGQWWLVVLNDSDQAGALGYHDLTDDLQPIGKVFARTDRQFGCEPSVTASHELVEMLGDPHINLTAEDPGRSRLYAFENADAVEADECGYEIGGILVSDFVLPAYFDPRARGSGGPFDRKGHVSGPFEVARGGYMSFRDTRNMAAGWLQASAERTPHSRREGFPPGSRRERRKRGAKLVVSRRFR